MNQLQRLRDKKAEIKKVVKKSGWTNALLKQCDKATKEIRRLEAIEMRLCPPSGHERYKMQWSTDKQCEEFLRELHLVGRPTPQCEPPPLPHHGIEKHSQKL